MAGAVHGRALLKPGPLTPALKRPRPWPPASPPQPSVGRALCWRWGRWGAHVRGWAAKGGLAGTLFRGLALRKMGTAKKVSLPLSLRPRPWEQPSGGGVPGWRRGSPQFGLRDNRDTLGPILPAPRPVVCQDGRAPPSPMGAFQSPAFARFISAGTPRVGGPAATGQGAARGWPAGLCPGPQRPALRASPAGPLRSWGCCWRRARPAQCRDGHAPDPSGRLGWSRDKVFSHRSVNKPEVL